MEEIHTSELWRVSSQKIILTTPTTIYFSYSNIAFWSLFYFIKINTQFSGRNTILGKIHAFYTELWINDIFAIVVICAMNHRSRSKLKIVESGKRLGPFMLASFG